MSSIPANNRIRAGLTKAANKTAFMYVPPLVIAALIAWSLFHFFGGDRSDRLRNDHPEEVEAIYECMDRLAQKMNYTNVGLPMLSSINSLCYSIVSTQFLAREQVIRNDNLVFQRSENIVIMGMVVAITLSGVVLAGLQLLASYRLASIGRGTFGDSAEVNLQINSVAVKSSTIGVIILAISFAFFMIFVLYVYTLKDDVRLIGSSGNAGRSANIGTLQTIMPNPPESKKTTNDGHPEQ